MGRLGKVGRGEVSPQLKEAKVKNCVLSSRVTFQEILLIKICMMKVQDKWELGSILGKAAIIAFNALQLTL